MKQEHEMARTARDKKINQRLHARHIVLLRLVRLEQEASRPCDAHISEISVYGCRIYTKAKLTVGDEISLCLSDIEMIDARIVWREGEGAGCQFRIPIGMDIIAQFALDVSAPQPGLTNYRR